MKKLILILAILVVASPAFAVLDVNLVRIGTTNQVQVYYKGADTANLPRGFALAFEVSTATADVCSISRYKSGESFYNPATPTDPCMKGYGIYPAKIAISSAGVVTNWGNPLADPCDPPTSTDQVLPSKNFILEFGSLYAPANELVNAPDANGPLCVLGFEPNGATPSFTIKMYSENVYRGGVVFEDGTTTDVNVSLTIATAAPDCFQDTNAVPMARWILQGKPKAWCCQWQNRGDATGDGKVTSLDLARLRLAWGGIWPAAPYDCRADFNHDGKVTSIDLARLRLNWGVNYGSTCQADWKDNCGPNP